MPVLSHIRCAGEVACVNGSTETYWLTGSRAAQQNAAPRSVCVNVPLRGVYSDTTQLNWTQLTQLNSVQPSQSCFCLWRHDLQTESTVVYAVELSSVEFSWVELCRYKHPFSLCVSLSQIGLHRWKIRAVGATGNVGPENAGLENDGLEFDGPEQRAVMSLVQDHMHTLRTVPISLCRQAYFQTVIFLP